MSGHLLSHSNSFGFKTEKDAAGCCVFNRNYYCRRQNVAQYFATVVLWGVKMTSAELKHRVKLQEWSAQIQNYRSSGLPVRAWYRQEGINASTYYRWKRELLTAANQAPCSGVPAVTFAELPEPKKMSHNTEERSATLRIGSASLDIYSGCNVEQLETLVALLRLC